MLSSPLNVFSHHPAYRDVASEDDYEFIIARCIAEAQDGHFSKIYAEQIPAIQKGLRHQMACAVNNLPYPLESGNPRQGTGAKILIIESNNKRAGFLLLLEDMPGTWNKGIELHLLSILPEYRNKGIGKQVVKDILKFTPALDIYARCYVKSVAMIHILTRIGFKITNTSNQGTQTLTFHR